jgi:hypothetical protein
MGRDSTHSPAMSDTPLGSIWLETRDGRLPGRVREVQYDRVLFQIEAPIQVGDLLRFALDLPDLEPWAEGSVRVQKVLATPSGAPAIYQAAFDEVEAAHRDRLDQWLDERTAIGALAGEPPGARDFEDLGDDVVTHLAASPKHQTGTPTDVDRGGRSAIGQALRKGVARARRLRDSSDGLDPFDES